MKKLSISITIAGSAVHRGLRIALWHKDCIVWLKDCAPEELDVYALHCGLLVALWRRDCTIAQGLRCGLELCCGLLMAYGLHCGF